MSSKVKRRTISQRSELLYDLQEYGINPDTREIWLHGYLLGSEEGEEPGVEYRMSTMFEKNMNFLSALSEGHILVHMHTIGGNWEDGMAIYDIIKACPYEVTILAYAHARSMSSLIFQAADYRVMMPHSNFLMHQGSYYFDGNVSSARAEWAEAEKAHIQMLKVYASRAVDGQRFKDRKTEKEVMKEIEELMIRKEEAYLSPREAIAYGLADAVLGDKGYENLNTLRG
jgi:ATP-dependent protease ClpP protease subunit